MNYEVMGANLWKHAPSLDAMAASSQKFFFDATKSEGSYVLGERATDASSELTVDFSDRSDADRPPVGGDLQDKELDTSNSLVFVSAPYTKTTELSGLFSGRLDFVCNKKDFDFQIALYEKTSAGDYIQLTPYWSRASYVGDLTHRHLLTPGKRQTITFKSNRLMSAVFSPGSRLVAVLGVIKGQDREINYGTGRTVAEETIADAKVPLKIRWLGSSYIEVPLGHP